jgi:hypothetical protein
VIRKEIPPYRIAIEGKEAAMGKDDGTCVVKIAHGFVFSSTNFDRSHTQQGCMQTSIRHNVEK